MEEETKLEKYKDLSIVEKIITYFIVYSFLGWCLETIYAHMVFGHFVKRGFLYGPICPIYGLGAVILIFNLKSIKNNKNWVKFFVAMISFTIFEYIASLILEILFHQRWWDYTGYFLNIQGRVCLTFSLLWGIIGVVFINNIHPWIKKKINKLSMNMNIKIKRLIIYSLMIIVIIDEVFSVIKYIKI